MLKGEAKAIWSKHRVGGRQLGWYIFFYGSHLALFSFGWWKQASDVRLAGLNTLKFSVWFSRGQCRQRSCIIRKSSQDLSEQELVSASAMTVS